MSQKEGKMTIEEKVRRKGKRMKKYAYDDNFSPIVKEIMFKAD